MCNWRIAIWLAGKYASKKHVMKNTLLPCSCHAGLLIIGGVFCLFVSPFLVSFWLFWLSLFVLTLIGGRVCSSTVSVFRDGANLTHTDLHKGLQCIQNWLWRKSSPPGCRVRHRESMSVLFSWISALKLLHLHFHGISLNCDKTTVKLEICIRKCSTCYTDAMVRNNPLKCQKSKNTQHNVTEVTELVFIT